MTPAEIALIKAALHWYRTNRHNFDLLDKPEMIRYYSRPEVRALVEACADFDYEDRVSQSSRPRP